MNRTKLIILLVAVLCHGCYEPTIPKKPNQKKSEFIFRETIAKGTDTGMIRLGKFKMVNQADVLCQRWQFENQADTEGETEPANDSDAQVRPEIVLFKDSSAVVNPTGNIRLGKWHIVPHSKPGLLILSFFDSTKSQYLIEDIASQRLLLTIPGVNNSDSLYTASGQTHRNMYNDPFHPVNNQWRLKPKVMESDSSIHIRVKNCLRFFALYYRDQIKRQTETISFKGLPSIFKWYSGGIGLPDKEDLSASWTQCFYNKEQAVKGYEILRKLIVDYEFNWPKRAPSWVYQTHSVLEQMYHKVDKLR